MFCNGSAKTIHSICIFPYATNIQQPPALQHQQVPAKQQVLQVLLQAVLYYHLPAHRLHQIFKVHIGVLSQTVHIYHLVIHLCIHHVYYVNVHNHVLFFAIHFNVWLHIVLITLFQVLDQVNVVHNVHMK